MKVGFLIDDRGFHNICFENIEKGNPGVGGTWYEFALVSTLLQKECPNDYVFVFHFNKSNLFHPSLNVRIIGNELEAIALAGDLHIDYIVFRNGKDEAWYTSLEKNKIKSIAWAHNFLTRDELCRLKNAAMVKRVVFVGREQYDQYLDEDVIKKSTYIYNIVEKTDPRVRERFNHDVTFIGTIIPDKGFHMVAKIWKKVLLACPDAQLHIIGSGKLYDATVEMGAYGIAERMYEKSFIAGITDNDGKLLDSVHFHGILGDEKNSIILNSAVGVVNPTSSSETFCISAVEFEQFGVPVCYGGKYGLLDTVKNKETGLLSLKSRRLARNIIHLLNDSELNEKYGRQAIKHATNFTSEKIMPYWIDLFENLEREKKVHLIFPKRISPIKMVKLVSYYFRIKLGLLFLPAVDEIKICVHQPLAKIKHMILK